MSAITSLPIPVHRTVQEFKANASDALATGHAYDELAQGFAQRYGQPPTHIVVAPGRVNIIGEHIDYSLFGVLPAAIENQMAIAIRATPSSNGSITVSNRDSDYTPATFSAIKDDKGEWDLAIDQKALRWESYVKAGYLVSELKLSLFSLNSNTVPNTWESFIKGVLERFFAGSIEEPVGMNAHFTSTIPAGSGVSSSAALIVASTLAFLVVNGKLSSITKGDLIGMSVGNEKKVGTNRMDQSASILSTPGNLLYISFYPSLQASPTPLPSLASTPSAFVIANSLAVSNKAETGKSRYNLRVVETLVGARILSKILGLEIVDQEERATYRQVLERWWKKQGRDDNEANIKAEITALLEGGYLDKLKGKEQDGVLLQEMVEMSGLSEADFHRVFLSWVEVEATYFQLYRRAKHVFTEALRVLQFRDLCSAGASSSASPSETLLEDLGNLMDESQQSCSRFFECSCPELETLTGLAKQSGAYGSRLTGAGWGGCCVSLVKQEDVETFMSKLRTGYEPYKNLSDEEFKLACFATKPAEGACVFEV